MSAKSIVLVLSAGLVLAHTSAADSEVPAVWAQSGDDDAIRWSGAKADIEGFLHSNGGIRVTGSKNEFIGGARYVITFFNSKPIGI